MNLLGRAAAAAPAPPEHLERGPPPFGRGSRPHERRPLPRAASASPCWTSISADLRLMIAPPPDVYALQPTFHHQEAQNTPAQIVLGSSSVVAVQTKRVTHVRVSDSSIIRLSK